MSETSDPRAIRLTSNLDHLDLARDFVAEIARRVPMEAREIHDLELALTEALTNVIEHAYEGVDGRMVEISVTHGDDEFTVVISHEGGSIDLAAHPDPNMREYLAQRRVGGLGLYLIRKLMDEVEYTTDAQGQSHFRMVKRRATGLLPPS